MNKICSLVVFAACLLIMCSSEIETHSSTPTPRETTTSTIELQNRTRWLELEADLKRYERISNSPMILLSLLSAFVHGFLFVALPIIVFASNKQKTVNLIKSKTANLDKI
jgi:hypothetical protein